MLEFFKSLSHYQVEENAKDNNVNEGKNNDYHLDDEYAHIHEETVLKEEKINSEVDKNETVKDPPSRKQSLKKKERKGESDKKKRKMVKTIEEFKFSDE